MKALAAIWGVIRSLFQIQTGIGRHHDQPHGEWSAYAIVFLPVAGFAVGFASMLAAALFQTLNVAYLPALAGVAVLAALGGARQADAIVSIRRGKQAQPGGAMMIVALTTLFLVFGLNGLQNPRGSYFIGIALLYMPSIGSLAMIAAASILPESPDHERLSSSKGVHLLLASALSLVLLLPAFGVAALAYMGVGVLAGSLTALISGRKEFRAELLYAAAAFAQLAFLLLLLLGNPPVVYY